MVVHYHINFWKWQECTQFALFVFVFFVFFLFLLFGELVQRWKFAFSWKLIIIYLNAILDSYDFVTWFPDFVSIVQISGKPWELSPVKTTHEWSCKGKWGTLRRDTNVLGRIFKPSGCFVEDFLHLPECSKICWRSNRRMQFKAFVPIFHLFIAPIQQNVPPVSVIMVPATASAMRQHTVGNVSSNWQFFPLAICWLVGDRPPDPPGSVFSRHPGVLRCGWWFSPFAMNSLSFAFKNIKNKNKKITGSLHGAFNCWIRVLRTFAMFQTSTT
jgi:hypothetical protein